MFPFIKGVEGDKAGRIGLPKPSILLYQFTGEVVPGSRLAIVGFEFEQKGCGLSGVGSVGDTKTAVLALSC